jgi:predicted naringenin-chalcone synthase
VFAATASAYHPVAHTMGNDANPFRRPQSECLSHVQRLLAHDRRLYPYLEFADQIHKSSTVQHRSCLVPFTDTFGKPWSHEQLLTHQRKVRGLVHSLGASAIRKLMNDNALTDADMAQSSFTWHTTNASIPQGDIGVARAAGVVFDASYLHAAGACSGGFSQMQQAVRYLSEDHPLLVCATGEVASQLWTGGFEGSLELALDTLRGAAFDRMVRSIVVSSALFGDGAAASFVAREDHPILKRAPFAARRMLRMEAWGATSAPHTEHVVTIETHAKGMHVDLGRELTAVNAASGFKLLKDVFAAAGVTVQQCKHFLVHPGGPAMIEAFVRDFAIDPKLMRHSFDTLRENGNCGSVTTPNIQDRILADQANLTPGDLVCGFGAGPGVKSGVTLYRVI